MTPEAFPLQWPTGIHRTQPQDRRFGSFQVSPAEARNSLIAEVERSGGRDIIISSNTPLRRDGYPYASGRAPDDPGIAIYFTRKGKQICIPCDAFDRTWKNMRALALSIRDMRGPETRGCAAITDQAFTGFLALPPPNAARPWRDVFAVSTPTPAALHARYKELARQYAQHNDQKSLSEINAARDEARAEGFM